VKVLVRGTGAAAEGGPCACSPQHCRRELTTPERQTQFHTLTTPSALYTRRPRQVLLVPFCFPPLPHRASTASPPCSFDASSDLPISFVETLRKRHLQQPKYHTQQHQKQPPPHPLPYLYHHSHRIHVHTACPLYSSDRIRARCTAPRLLSFGSQ
jgi:hypothetical protein